MKFVQTIKDQTEAISQCTQLSISCIHVYMHAWIWII